jgi:hypothetical protein
LVRLCRRCLKNNNKNLSYMRFSSHIIAYGAGFYIKKFLHKKEHLAELDTKNLKNF